MAERIERRSRYLRDFAAALSHEFKTPIAGISGAIELLQDHEGSMSDEERRRFNVEWPQQLFEGGWICATWPREYGGGGMSPIEQFILNEELARSGAPPVGGSAVGLLVFFAFALQCVSTIAVMRRETAGWKWPALQFGYMLALARRETGQRGPATQLVLRDGGGLERVLAREPRAIGGPRRPARRRTHPCLRHRRRRSEDCPGLRQVSQP